MAVLQDLKLRGIQSQQFRAGLLIMLAEEFWEWYDQNLERSITSVPVFSFLRFTIRVKHLRNLFVLLFGEHP